MEHRLPPPSQLLCSHLWSKVVEAGVNLNKDDVILLSRIFCDYVQNTADGKKTVLKLLNATVKKPDPTNAYLPAKNSTATTALKSEELIYYSGWIYKGTKSVPADAVEIDKGGGLEGCEITGILGPKEYCVQMVKDFGRGGRESLVFMSNYARMMSENLSIRETSKPENCRNCTTLTCEFHPNRGPQQLLLSAPAP
jgi:hypothetical protein